MPREGKKTPPNTAIASEVDTGNKNHLLLDSINSVRVWRLQRRAHPCEVLEKHPLHVTLRDGEFPAIPRWSCADVLSNENLFPFFFFVLH